ncbi:MAG: polysaccharide pyruvyl transferase family protein [Clostridiales bacterium]|nr:polysaccharide pyruvyl transferase family protein [Clostridiales bacterium]
MNSKKILYLGWIGYGNIGDDLLFDVFKKMISNISSDIVVNYYCPFSKKNINLKDYDLVVLGGGSLLGKHSESSISPFVLYSLKVVQEGIPLVIWGSGIDVRIREYADKFLNSYIDKNKNATLSSNPYYKTIINYSKAAGVRGNLTKYIINLDKVETIGDPGIIFDKVFPNIPDFKDFADIKASNKLVLINWGTSFNRILGQSEEAIKEELKKVINKLLNHGYEIVIYPVWEKDIEACKNLASDFVGKKVKCIDKLYNVYQIISLIKKCKFTINFKLHANILSMAYKKPFICLSYGLKGYDFCDSINSTKLCIFTDEVKAENILEKINYIRLNYRDLQNKFNKFINIYYKKHLDFIDNIVKITKVSGENETV